MSNTWAVESTAKFDKAFKKLDKYTQRLVKNWIVNNLAGTTNPRLHGKPLTGNLSGIWRYRIGNCRLLCKLKDDKLVILALNIAHRKDIYMYK